MKDLLVVVDMQVDFVNGALGTKEAEQIVDSVVCKVKKARECGKDIIFTLDTHGQDYLMSQEGKKLPVPHCIKGTQGWELVPELAGLARREELLEKPTFGSMELVGLCTDICVISNALLLKAALWESQILVDASCCAGVTPKSHENALEAMKMCQIQVEGE